AQRRPDRRPRRPPDRDARRRRRTRVQGRRGRSGRRDGRYILPRVFRAPGVGGEAMIVAIDGPAGAGKSTVARTLAERLGFRYLETGAMYRALTGLATSARSWHRVPRSRCTSLRIATSARSGGWPTARASVPTPFRQICALATRRTQSACSRRRTRRRSTRPIFASKTLLSASKRW